jgi:hypothetical protein
VPDIVPDCASGAFPDDLQQQQQQHYLVAAVISYFATE